MQCKVTPEMFWQFRRAQLGGKSAVTGDPLPAKLEDCNPGVQADHYAQACYAMANYVLACDYRAPSLETCLLIVPLPSGVDAARGTQIRSDAIGLTFLPPNPTPVHPLGRPPTPTRPA
jgi:hypothetical protein